MSTVGVEPITVRLLYGELSSVLAASDTLKEASEHHALDREAREILATLLGMSMGDVARLGGSPISDDQARRARSIVERRAKGEPLAYALGSAAFRHLELMVDRRVLIPRPETELLVEHALRVTAGRPGGIAVDIGTGSGAIALSLATEGHFDSVIATDLSPDALTVARENAQRVLSDRGDGDRRRPTLGSQAVVEFREGKDFEPLGGIRARVIVSNPPYIAPDEAGELPASVREWEPAMALFADDGGMARYDALLSGAPSHLEPGGWLVLEVDARRGNETAKRAVQTGRFSSVELCRDFSNRDRVLLARVGGDIT